jgi:hypothetical protein
MSDKSIKLSELMKTSTKKAPAKKFARDYKEAKAACGRK